MDSGSKFLYRRSHKCPQNILDDLLSLSSLLEDNFHNFPIVAFTCVGYEIPALMDGGCLKKV